VIRLLLSISTRSPLSILPPLTLTCNVLLKSWLAVFFFLILLSTLSQHTEKPTDWLTLFSCFSPFRLGVSIRANAGAEPQVLPAANRVDLSSQLSSTPAGALGISRHQCPPSRRRLPPLLAVSATTHPFAYVHTIIDVYKPRHSISLRMAAFLESCFLFFLISCRTAVRLVEFHYSLMELTKVNTPPHSKETSRWRVWAGQDKPIRYHQIRPSIG
jgi:hypothetical protein